jgi:DNA-binding PadR family transcriptional regulator
MHRAAALLTLKEGTCKEMFYHSQTGEYEYPRCESCSLPCKNLEYVLTCSVDYEGTRAVELLKWYRGINLPLSTVLDALKEGYEIKDISPSDAHTVMKEEAFTVLTDGDSYHALLGTHEHTLEQYLALREIEEHIRELGGTITYCADEEAFERMEKGEFSFLLLTPDITKKDVQTFSRKGFPRKGEVFPPKSTRHRFPARPLKINVPLQLLIKGDIRLRQEQLKVFLRRKRKLVVTGRLEQYLEKFKILFGEPGELKDLKRHPHLWACEFPREFYEIKFTVDEFTEEVREVLLHQGMEIAYSALIRETNRLIFIISEVKDSKKTEKLIYEIMESRFPAIMPKSLFGVHEDSSPVWMIPMEDYTPSRAYFEQSERILRRLLRIHKVLKHREGKEYAIVRDVVHDHGDLLGQYSSEDLLLLFALHLLGSSSGCKLFEYLHEDLPDHETVFQCLETLANEGLINASGEKARRREREYILTQKGNRVIEKALDMVAEVSQTLQHLSRNRFTEFLEEIDSNVTHVIKPDGRKVDFHIGSIMESLLFTDIGWRKVSDVLDRVAHEFQDVDFVSTDELTNFVEDCLEDRYPLSNIPSRYDYFVNSRDYIFLHDDLKDEKIISLSRNFIEKDIDRLFPPFLKMSARQKSQLSNMIYESIRLLTVPLIKELYEKERIIIPRGFFSQLEEFMVYQALPLVKECTEIDEDHKIDDILLNLMTHAQTHVNLAWELLERSDEEFLTYYLKAMDALTQSISVGLGWVPVFDVRGRLSQLASLVKESEVRIDYFRPEDQQKFFRRLNNSFRRATALLDQWRSLHRKYQGAPVLSHCKSAWEHHIQDIQGLISIVVHALR